MIDLLTIALGEYGVSENKDAGEHNPRILHYLKEIGYSGIKDDETPWCSTFVNYCAKMVGREQSKKLNARSWLDVGETVTEPELGDIVIFWRESPTSHKGHVAIYINKDKNYHYVLGGNQGNSVSIQPYSNSRVIGYRRLKCL